MKSFRHHLLEGGPGSGVRGHTTGKDPGKLSANLAKARERETLAASRIKQFQQKIASSGDQSLWTSKEYQDLASEYHSAVRARQTATKEAKDAVSNFNKESCQEYQPKAQLFGAYFLGKKKARANESATTSAAGPQTRAQTQKAKPVGQKESASKPMRFLGRLREADAAPTPGQPSGRRFRVVLLSEGMGNFEDAYYYTRQAIESCPPIFEGKKLFIDHPSAFEEETLPERSVTDIGGYFENCGVGTGDGGEATLEADLVTVESPAIVPIRALMLESLEFSKTHPDQDLVGLSINAGGQFDTMPIDQFMRTAQIPSGCMAKLQEAVAKGIQLIRPVSQMTAAKSCDLVTEAGAGGRISQLLERKREHMAKEKGKEADAKESKEKKEAGHKEDGAGAPPDKDGSADGQTGDQPGADQDEELIKSMMKKYLGDGFTQEDMQMAREAVANAKEMGMDEDEAMKCAGYNFKMAKHMQAKGGATPPPPTAKNDTPPAGGGAPAQESADGNGFSVHAKSGPAASKVPSSEQKESKEGEEAKNKESARSGASKREIELSAENARLKGELEEINLEKFIDQTLRESKLPMRATKSFRECLKGIKTQKEVTEKFTVFQEAWRARGGEADDMPGFYITPEKTGALKESGRLDFSDCKVD